MNTKFVISGAVSAFLVAAIYSSVVFVQFASSQKDYKDYCAFGPGGSWVCIVISEKAGVYIVNCKEECQVEGLTPPPARTSPLPSDLKDALNTAIVEFENTTKAPKTDLLDLLKDNTLLNGDNNTSEQATASQNRFCMEGTGGSTGRECIPCDPGLRFEVGCIDILTGGPLDLETATSESGKNNTKVPKDLGGLLEEDGSTEGNDDTEVPKVPGGLKGDE